MKFGKRYDEASTTTSSGGGGKWIKVLKEGETRIRFLQEISDWVVYYEHYNPAGTSFPCTGDRDTCPGCTATNERMKSASRKVAVNAIVGSYQDVYKLPITLVNRLKIKADRNGGTITDRDYLITRIGKDKDTEYDVETGNALPIDLAAYELMDVESMLATQFSENWPDFQPNAQPEEKKSGQKVNLYNPAAHQPERGPLAQEVDKKASTIDQLAASMAKQGETKSPPSEPAAQSDAGEQEVEITLEQLHGMTPEQLRALCTDSGAVVPDELTTQQEIISWMEKQFA